jgi:hypothetical protein
MGEFTSLATPETILPWRNGRIRRHERLGELPAFLLTEWLGVNHTDRALGQLRGRVHSTVPDAPTPASG